MKSKERRKFNLYSISESRDLIFGLATFWIAIYHSRIKFNFLNNTSFIGDILYKIMTGIKITGDIGVELFLFLSGVGLYFSFSKCADIPSFYKKRFMRVVPESLSVSLIWYGFIAKCSRFSTFIKKSFFLGLFINGDRKFWFITIILILYLIYPLIHKLYDKYGLKSFVYSLSGIILFNCLLSHCFGSFYDKTEILFTRIPIFLIGAYLARYIKSKKDIPMFVIYALMVLLVVIWPLDILREYGTIHFPFVIVRYSYIPVSIAIIVLISYIRSFIKIELVEKLFTWYGSYSVEVYLTFKKISDHLASVVTFNDPYNFIQTAISLFVSITIAILLKKFGNYISELANRKSL